MHRLFANGFTTNSHGFLMDVLPQPDKYASMSDENSLKIRQIVSIGTITLVPDHFTDQQVVRIQDAKTF